MSTISAWGDHRSSSVRSPVRQDHRNGRLQGDYSKLDIDLSAAEFSTGPVASSERAAQTYLIHSSFDGRITRALSVKA